MADTLAPDLDDFTFTPGKIDTSGGPAAVTVNLRLSDTPAGVAGAEVRFKAPTAYQIADAYFDSTKLISGDEFKGEYESIASIPQFSEQGQWTVEYVSTRDKAGNVRNYQTADLKNLGFKVNLAQKGPGDTTPPDVASFQFNPTTVNTASASQLVTVTLTLTDKPAGVAGAEVRFKAPSGQPIADAYFDATKLIAGDEFKGEYESTATLPRYAAKGDWQVEYVFVRDKAGTMKTYQTADLQNLGFGVTLTQSGLADGCAPYLAAMTFTPSQVNASGGPQMFKTRVELSDRPAGVAGAEVRLRSPSGGQLVDAYFDDAQRISGDQFHGEYEASTTVPQFAEVGTWSIEYVLLRDRAGNWEHLTSADVQGSGLPANLIVA